MGHDGMDDNETSPRSWEPMSGPESSPTACWWCSELSLQSLQSRELPRRLKGWSRAVALAQREGSRPGWWKQDGLGLSPDSLSSLV